MVEVRSTDRTVVRQTGRRDVVEEPAPLVVGDAKRGPWPQRRVHDGLRDEGEERLAPPDVGVRVVVVGAALVLTEEERVEIAERRQRAGSRLREERLHVSRDREVLLTPQRQERQVAGV